MSQIFNFKRFATYFKYDLLSARGNYLLSLIIISLIPLWALIIYELVSIISGHGFSDANAGLQISSIVTAIVMLVITAPVKLYGQITDKKAGSAWVMTPASTFEKFLSILIMTCIVLPLAAGVLLFGIDAILAALVPGFDGSAFGHLCDLDKMVGDPEVHFSSVLWWVSWCQNILAFTLGAIWFKKGKAGKTFLCLMGISILLVSIIVLIAGSTNVDIDMLERWFGADARTMQVRINWAVSIIYLIVFGLLCSGIYFRAKTIKH